MDVTDLLSACRTRWHHAGHQTQRSSAYDKEEDEEVSAELLETALEYLESMQVDHKYHDEPKVPWRRKAWEPPDLPEAVTSRPDYMDPVHPWAPDRDT